MTRTRSHVPGLTLALALAFMACAREEMPPGTGPDFEPPAVTEMFPAHGSAVPGLDDDAYIRFDEPLGDPRSVSRTLQTSPAWVYDISAGRRSVRIRPLEGWRPGVVYTFRIPPGLRDLVRNQTSEPIEWLFTTGAEFFETRASGVVWDRETVRTMRDIAVQVIGSDSVPYAAVTDTSGSFVVEGLPAGYYWAFAFRDQNRNRVLDRDFEPHDSGLVSLPDPTTAVRLELWLVAPDSTPPMLSSAVATDSLSLRLEFDDLLEPDARLDSASVRVTQVGSGEDWPVAEFVIGVPAPVDSTSPQVEGLDAARTDEAEPAGPPPAAPGEAQASQPADSLSVASATVERARPQNFVSVRLGRPLAQGEYDVSARGFTNLRQLAGGGDTTVVYEPPPVALEEEAQDGDIGDGENGSVEVPEDGAP